MSTVALAPSPYRKASAPVVNPRKAARSLVPRSKTLAAPFDKIRMSFADGLTWLRVMPPHMDSKVQSWLYSFLAYDLIPTKDQANALVPEVPVPTSLVGHDGARDPIKGFDRFLQDTYPALLHKADMDKDVGLSLYGKERAACFAFIHKAPLPLKDGEYPIRVFIGSYYDGSRGANNGFLYRLDQMTREQLSSPDGKNLGLKYGDFTDPDEGHLIGVKVTRKPKTAPNYGEVQIYTEQKFPVIQADEIARKHPDYAKYCRPIEEAIYCPTERELIDILTTYVEHKVSTRKVDSVALIALKEFLGNGTATGLPQDSTEAAPENTDAMLEDDITAHTDGNHPPIVPPALAAAAATASVAPATPTVSASVATPPPAPAPAATTPNVPKATTPAPAGDDVSDIEKMGKDELLEILTNYHIDKEGNPALTPSPRVKKARIRVVGKFIKELSEDDRKLIAI